jgi:hypothetical protein
VLFAYPYLDVPPGAICTQMFRTDDTSGWLAITQLAGAAADSRFKTAGPGTAWRWRAVQVRGHRGWLAAGRLTWYEAGQSILIVTAGRPAGPPAAGAGLLAIARSLR